MSILLEKTPEDCANIYCENKLGYFDVKNKRRFCRKCRVSNKLLEWKCRDCNNTISDSQHRETRRLCNRCKGLEKQYE